MIIYALIIIAILFFLVWNLVDRPVAHMITASVTTLLFVVVVFFAIANFKDHYGMHLVDEPQTVRPIRSVVPQPKLKMIVYQPMGSHRNSQIVVYRNASNHKTHTDPDLSVTNRIVQKGSVTRPHVATKVSRWRYRSPLAREWFGVANHPRNRKVDHVFYVPKSWHVLSAKQARAFNQIVLNKGRQLKSQMKSTAGQQKARQEVSMTVKSQLGRAMQKDPSMSKSEQKRITKAAVRKAKAQLKQKAEAKIIPGALKTAETIH